MSFEFDQSFEARGRAQAFKWTEINELNSHDRSSQIAITSKQTLAITIIITTVTKIQNTKTIKHIHCLWIIQVIYL